MRSQGLGLFAPLRQRNFRFYYAGAVLAMVGSQLTLIAFPWLVLKVTGDPLAMGLVFAVEGIPRAAFMIFGGAFTDRFSPRTVLLVSTALRGAVMLLLGSLTLADVVSTPLIFAAALVFGVLDAFAFPASSAFVPRLLDASQLPAGNALIQGVNQITTMVGPAAAGLVIAGFAGYALGDGAAANTSAAADLPGIAAVFIFVGLAFAVALGLLSLVTAGGRTGPLACFSARQILNEVGEGFSAMWNDLPVRIITLVFTIFTLFWRGPYLVGVPVLCEMRFEQGALAFGFFGSAMGLGALFGTIFAGALARPGARWFGLLILIDTAVLGCSFLVYAQADTIAPALAATVLAGLFDGYMVVLLISWLQTRVPGELMGRVMSMIMFFNSGLAPVSAAGAGVLISLSLTGMFMGAGGLLVTLSLVGLSIPVVRTLGMENADSADGFQRLADVSPAATRPDTLGSNRG
ncbi:MAG: hypothetical protein CMQ29_03885 [Gammaproteobacteria bacterium]|nr:hypothetical protein [Gammaproteobacteria bacterium]